MTTKSIAPYFDLGVIVDAELALIIAGEAEAWLGVELGVVLEPADVTVFISANADAVAVDMVVETVELGLELVVPVVEDWEDEEEEVWMKTPPDEDAMLEVTDD